MNKSKVTFLITYALNWYYQSNQTEKWKETLIHFEGEILCKKKLCESQSETGFFKFKDKSVKRAFS